MTYPPHHAHARRPGPLLLGLLALAASACSTPDANSHAASPSGPGAPVKRDVEMTHEPCDAPASGGSKVDVRGTGKPTIVHVMKGSKEACRILDLNMDGAPDAFIYYDDQGRERRRESSYARDGRMNEIQLFENGVLVRKLLDTTADGKIDTWDYYQGGRLVRSERDTDGDGVVDEWWEFNNPTNPNCAIVASDRNADGKPDPDSVVDTCADGAHKPGAAPVAGAASASASAAATAAPVAPPPAPSASAAAVAEAPSAAPAAPSAAASATPNAPKPARKK